MEINMTPVLDKIRDRLPRIIKKLLQVQKAEGSRETH